MNSPLNRNLLYFGSFYGPTGYCNVNRSIATELYNRGLIFSIKNHDKWCGLKIPVNPIFDTLQTVPVTGNIVLSSCLHEQQVISEGSINVLLTMFETTTGIPPLWVDAAKKTDAIIVPNKFNKEIWTKAGVPAYKLHSITLGVDHKVYNLDTQRIPFLVNGKDIVELHKNRVIAVQEVITRKNIEALLEAWLCAFPTSDGSTCLIIKANSFSLSNTGKIYKILRKLRNKYNIRNHAPIYTYTTVLQDEELPGFLANGTHYFSMSHGEAVDMSMLQMGALGATLVVPKHTGYKDYLSDSVAYLINSTSGPVSNLSFPIRRIYAGCEWSNPDIDHAITQLKNAIEHPTDRSVINSYMQQYSWSRTADQIVSILEDLAEPKNTPIALIKKTPAPVVVCPSLGQNCGIAEYTKEYSQALATVTPHIAIGGPVSMYRDYVAHPTFNLLHIQHEYQFFSPTRLKFYIDQAHRFGKKAVITQHTLASRAADHNAIIKTADMIFVHSETNKDYCIYEMGYSPLKVHVVPMGIGKPLDKLSIPKDDDSFVISYFGMAYFHKNIHGIINSYKELKPKYPKLNLLILASKPKQDTYYFDYCKRLVAGVPDVLWFDQYVPDTQILNMLSMSDLQIYDYDHYGSYGTSASIRMGLRAQRPLLVNDTCWFSDLPENIAPRISKFGGLTNAIEAHLMGYNFESWIDDIKQYVKDNSWDNVISQHTDLYKQVLKNG